MTRWLRDPLLALWRSLPRTFRLRLLADLVRAESAGDPADALRALFEVEDALQLAVGGAAMRFGGGEHPRHRLTDLHAFFASRVRDGERVLDVGCGLGTLAHALVAAREVTVLAVDEDPRSIELARSRHPHPRLEFRLGDARRDLPEGQFDVALLSHFLEHLEHRRAFLHGLRARQQPGRLLLRLPLFDRDWTVPLRRELGVRWKSDDGHFAELTEGEWIAELAEAALTVTHREVRWGELWCEARFG